MTHWVVVTENRRMGANTSEMIISSFVYRRMFEGSVQTNLEVLYKHCACVGKNEHVWYVLQLAAWYSICVYCTPLFCQHPCQTESGEQGVEWWGSWSSLQGRWVMAKLCSYFPLPGFSRKYDIAALFVVSYGFEMYVTFLFYEIFFFFAICSICYVLCCVCFLFQDA